MSATLHPAASTITSASLAEGLSAIFTGAAFAPIADRAFLRISGPDATHWLNGMVTNTVQALAPGEGCYNFLLNAQGRILGDCTIYRDPKPEPPGFLLETDASQVDAIHAHLDHFIIMDDVELTRVEGDRTGLEIVGPDVFRLLAAIDLDSEAQESEPLELVHITWHSKHLDLIRAHSPLVPRFEFWSDSAGVQMVRDQLLVAGATPVSHVPLEALRILSGMPRYGADIRNTDKAHDLPQETAQDRALHFAKGCYLGQEIVERIRSRGSVHRTFAGFVLSGGLPAAGTELSTESAPRPVGELTSVAVIPNLAQPDGPPLQLALGYIRREALDRNLPLTYPGGTAAPAALPFAIPGLTAARS